LDKSERKRRREKKKKKPQPPEQREQLEQQQLSQSDVSDTFVSGACRSASLVIGYSKDELMQILSMALDVHRSLTRNLMRFFGKNPSLFGQITRCP
jgi:hypothetical protein